MRKLHVAMIGVIFAVAAAGSGQTLPFTSVKDKPWYEGFEPVQKLITASSYGGGLDSAFKMLSYHVATLSFRVDSTIMRREWETYTLADGNTMWTTRTRLVYNLSNRPLYELMDHIAKMLDARWRVENDVCLLEPNPEPAPPIRDTAKPPAIQSLQARRPARPDRFLVCALEGAVGAAVRQ